MSITRAQYLSGDGTYGPVLNGQVQGITAGTGVSIDALGVLTLAPATTTDIGGVIPDGTSIQVSPTGVISSNVLGVFRQVDDISGLFNGATTLFPITVAGAPFFPGSTENILISLGGVLQVPGAAYTIPTGSSSIQFASPPPVGTTFAGYVIATISGTPVPPGTGTVTSVGTGVGLTGGPIVTTGTISLVPATTSLLGGVIPDGTTITVTGSGVISATLPPTSPYQIINLGALEAIDGIRSVFTLVTFGTATPYTPTTSSTNIAVFLGGIPQLPGAANAYTVSGNQITFTSAPPAGSTFLAITVA